MKLERKPRKGMGGEERRKRQGENSCFLTPQMGQEYLHILVSLEVHKAEM